MAERIKFDSVKAEYGKIVAIVEKPADFCDPLVYILINVPKDPEALVERIEAEGTLDPDHWDALPLELYYELKTNPY